MRVYLLLNFLLHSDSWSLMKFLIRLVAFTTDCLFKVLVHAKHLIQRKLDILVQTSIKVDCFWVDKSE